MTWKNKALKLQKLAIMLYCVLTAENLIYLAYFKDVMFCSAVVAEFCGMFYFTFEPPTAYSPAIKTVLIVMISINFVCGVFTLIA